MCVFFCTFAGSIDIRTIMMENFQAQERYLRLLSERFPNSDAVVTELINLHAILALPKGTEHFVSDLHGASNAFIHMIKNASGVIRRKVDDIYGDTLTEKEKRALCALIYYPDERIRWVTTNTEKLNSEEGLPMPQPTINDWYARRMGMTNHDDAYNTKWIRIYRCMKKDTRDERFRERLSKIKMNKK